MKTSLEKNKTAPQNITILIQFISLMVTLVFGIVQLMNISHNIEKSAKLETYKLIEQLLNDSYPTIENFRTADKFDKSTEESTAKELESFLFQLNTCIEVGACDRKVTLAFLCNSPKISGPLSYSSGIAKASISLEKVIKSAELQESFAMGIRHVRVMEILSRIFGNTGKWKPYNLIIEAASTAR